MSEDRRLMVLRAIVQDYVADLRAGRVARRSSSATTSGSSAATVRNDMAAARGGGPHPRAAHLGRPGARPTRATACSSTGSAPSSR